MSANLPLYLRRPELNLRPFSEYKHKLSFWRRKPDYVENPEKSTMKDYLWIARREKLGILYWHTEDGCLWKSNTYRRIIPCEFDAIEKFEDHFVCYKDGECDYRDLDGNILM